MDGTYYRLGLYEKSMPNTVPLRDKLTHAKRAGFDYLELSIDETDEKLARLDWSDGEVLTLQQAVCETGVPIASICLSGHRKYPLGSADPAVARRGLEMMQKAIALAARLSVRQIQIAGYDVYYEPSTEDTRRRFGENLARSVEMAARMGVLLAFETMETPFLNTITKAMHYVREINSPYLQIYPDIGNVTNAVLAEGGTVLQDMEAGRGHLSAMHLKETVPGVFREVPYGTGHVQFGPAIRKALDLGVRMFVGEFWYTGNADWEQVMWDAAGFLRGHFPDEGEV